MAAPPLTTEVDASKVKRKRDPGRCFIKAGWREYTFIEVMTCPGGCIAGGGQPIGADRTAIRARMEASEQRAQPNCKSLRLYKKMIHLLTEKLRK